MSPIDINNNYTTCKNCGQQFQDKFCNGCGQKASIERVNLNYILHALRTNLLQVDRGLFYTINQLFTRPGDTIREYLEGKRVKHFKPIAYVLVISTIYALTTYLFGMKTHMGEALSGFVEGGLDSPGEELPNEMLNALSWIGEKYAYTNLLLIPFFSVASYLAFFKFDYNYYEHIVLNAFLAGQKALIHLLFVPASYIIGEGTCSDYIDILRMVLSILFTFWTFVQFFKSDKTLKKIFLVFLSYFILILGILLFGFGVGTVVAFLNK